MAMTTHKIKVAEPKAQPDHQPRDPKGKWKPPMTTQNQPKEQDTIGPARPSIYMDAHRHVKGTALDKPSPRIEPPARKAPEPGKNRFTAAGKAGKGSAK
jgi:hypothetical protein